MRWHRTSTLALVLLAACSRGGDTGAPAGADSLDSEGLALPPSARAPRVPQPGGVPDTVAPPDTAVGDTTPPGPAGIMPPPATDVGAVIASYRRHYVELFHEMGSSVRGGVDPELVEEAKHRTGLDFGYVETSAWNDLVAHVPAAERARIAEGIAASNTEFARELHGAQTPPRG
jgi:hypothetical protein